MQAAQDPQDGWIPIRLAIFRFGIADADASEAPRAGADLFSVEAFEQAKGREGASRIGYESEPPTVEDLAELLRKHTGASKAEIDLEEGRFLFSFPLLGGGVASHGGTPWAILRKPDESLELNPRLAALLSNSVSAGDHETPYAGFAKIGAVEAAEGARQSEAVRFATGLVWRRFMLHAFDRVVEIGRVKLFARSPSACDDFQRLPSDIWPQLEIVDWEHGVARDRQGTLYSSIHVVDTMSDGAPQTSNDDSALHQKIRKVAKELWPSGDGPARIKERDAAIEADFRRKNQRPPNPRTIRRALPKGAVSGPGDH